MYEEKDVHNVISALEETRIIAILRGGLGERSLDAIGILLEEGIRVIEVTMNTPRVLETIAAVRAEFGDTVIIGAGTVRSTAEVKDVRLAGGQFIVSPNTNADVICATREAGMASFPGAFTCSEIIACFDAGANAVKLFPMVGSSPLLVRALRAPLGDVRLVPTGGITAANAAEYLRAGAWALGIGSELIGPDTASDDGLKQLQTRAATLVCETKPFLMKKTAHV